MDFKKQNKEIEEDYNNTIDQFREEQQPKNNPFGLSKSGIKNHTNILKPKKYSSSLNFSNKFNHEFKVENKNFYKKQKFKNINIKNVFNKK